MNLEQLKKLREKKFSEHKKKKKAYYLKSKINKKVIDYEAELNSENFFFKIKEIAHEQKKYVDDRKEAIILKLKEYKNIKKEYYEQNRKKRLEYNKEYRERKKEELKAYRKEYYQKIKEKKLEEE